MREAAKTAQHRRRREAQAIPNPTNAPTPGEGTLATHPSLNPLCRPSPAKTVPSAEIPRMFNSVHPEGTAAPRYGCNRIGPSDGVHNIARVSPPEDEWLVNPPIVFPSADTA